MSIITTSDFKNETYLRISEVGTQLDGYILKFEPEILTKILGYDLKKAFTEGLDGYGPEEKWTDLRDGKEYQINGIWYNYPGVKDIIINYVWIKFMAAMNDINASIGMRNVQTENSIPADARHKIVNVYNQMVNIISELDSFITFSNLDEEIYPNYNPVLFTKMNIFNI